MTIFIDDAKMSFNFATHLISEPDDRDRQIVKAWSRSRINHHFRHRISFREAVRRNRKTLKSPEAIKALFEARNYLFSTKTLDREETLYFENSAMKLTGRLRQRHREGPLAKIDKRTKEHRFLSQHRFTEVKEWHRRHKNCLPRFQATEKLLRAGKRHLEFAVDGRKVSGWHESGGRVRIIRRDIEGRVRSALKEILGIDHGRDQASRALTAMNRAHGGHSRNKHSGTSSILG